MGIAMVMGVARRSVINYACALLFFDYLDHHLQLQGYGFSPEADEYGNGNGQGQEGCVIGDGWGEGDGDTDGNSLGHGGFEILGGYTITVQTMKGGK